MATPTFSQLQSSPGNALAIMVSGQNPDGTTFELATNTGSPVAANISNGFLQSTTSTAATNLIVVPAGRTWSGTIILNVAVAVAAGTATAGAVQVELTTAGAGVIPVASIYGWCTALCGANAAGGTVGSQDSNNCTFPLTVIAPPANAVQIQITTTIAGTSGQVNATAIGALE